jgi:hypothetical protein
MDLHVGRKLLELALEICEWKPTLVLCGMAPGADTIGYMWAKDNNIPVEEYPAAWHKYGRQAGFIRNVDMAKNADALLALWNGYSKGTGHMIDIARKLNLKSYVKFY